MRTTEMAFVLGNYRRFRGQKFARTNYVPEKTRFFRTFPLINSQESYRKMGPAKKHGCPVVAPQAYIWY
jgi:hypothetical protein